MHQGRPEELQFLLPLLPVDQHRPYTQPDYLTKTFNINIPEAMNQYTHLLSLIITFVPIVISLILIFKSQTIVKLISRYEDTKIES